MIFVWNNNNSNNISNNISNNNKCFKHNGPAIIAMGVFDGVHEGHQFLLQQASADALHYGLPLWVVTFTIDPDEIFKPLESLNKLMSNEVRLKTLDATVADNVLAIPFVKDVAALSPECFLDSILATAFPPKVIHVGTDFRFGACAAGDVKQMQDWGKKHDCLVKGHQLLQDQGSPVTATRIRALLAAGDVQQAAVLLTRPYIVSAKVVRGRQAGTEIGFPTINLAIEPSFATVGDGVYAGYADVNICGEAQTFRAAISVGVPQTFGDLPSTTEAFLLDFPSEVSLYGTNVQLRFVCRLRDMRRFDTLDELAATIKSNVLWISENLK
ncbi:MAG: riboflavin biosynthesis protein RibF [Coriobacteriales bacterium]|nr:riboflavin biosynthesis protein RibF [Coriobacteriales bacterium]